MADVSFFIQNGWKNIWKQKTIWLFSMLPVVNQLFPTQYKQETTLPGALLPLGKLLTWVILGIISFIGVPYIAYSFSIGKSVIIQEVLSAIKKFSGRVIGCSCLGFLLVSPIIFCALVASYDASTRTFLSDKIILLSLPLAAFGALTDFSIFGFFANDWGIRQSIKNAWSLYTAHFGFLVSFGLIMAIIGRVLYAAVGLLTVLIQSGLDLEVLGKFNYINPFISLGKNIFFTLISGIGGSILNTFSVSVLALAYIKYSKAKSS